MFIKTIAIMLSLLLTSTVMASPLKSAFNDYQYTMTVEWDQKDKVFAQAATKQLESDLETQNLSKADLIAFVRSEIKDKKFSQDFEQVINSGMSVSEAQQILMNSLAKSQMAGASWNSQTNSLAAGLMVAFLLSSLIVVLILVEDDSRVLFPFSE